MSKMSEIYIFFFYGSTFSGTVQSWVWKVQHSEIYGNSWQVIIITFSINNMILSSSSLVWVSICASGLHVLSLSPVKKKKKKKEINTKYFIIWKRKIVALNFYMLYLEFFHCYDDKIYLWKKIFSHMSSYIKNKGSRL